MQVKLTLNFKWIRRTILVVLKVALENHIGESQALISLMISYETTVISIKLCMLLQAIISVLLKVKVAGETLKHFKKRASKHL